MKMFYLQNRCSAALWLTQNWAYLSPGHGGEKSSKFPNCCSEFSRHIYVVWRECISLFDIRLHGKGVVGKVQHYCFRNSLLVEQCMCSYDECPLHVTATKPAPSAQGEAVPTQSRAGQSLPLPGWQCWAWSTLGCTFWLPGRTADLDPAYQNPQVTFCWAAPPASCPPVYV